MTAIASALELFGKALRQGAAGAAIALASSFFALGALFGESGLTLMQSAAFSVFTFALPGQLVAAQLYSGGAGALAIVAAVLFVNARLAPMTVSLLPLLRPARERSALDFILAHWIAVTSWVFFMGTYREVREEDRLRWFALAGLFFWLAGVCATIGGYLAGALLPRYLLLGLLFLNPAYFLYMMLRSLTRQSDALAMLAGMILLPPMHYLLPEWDILAAGVVGGTIIFVISRRKPQQPKTAPE
ncbi:MAG: AzlC family ABC transporter permease [Gammaproteobacteria bacterium]